MIPSKVHMKETFSESFELKRIQVRILNLNLNESIREFKSNESLWKEKIKRSHKREHQPHRNHFMPGLFCWDLKTESQKAFEKASSRSQNFSSLFRLREGKIRTK